MNIKNMLNLESNSTSGDFVLPLFESAEPENLQDKNVQQVLDLKSKQFSFDSGVIMGSLTCDLSQLLFGLKEHDNLTKNFTDFSKSVASFLSAAEVIMTANDLVRLEAHYKKHSING